MEVAGSKKGKPIDFSGTPGGLVDAGEEPQGVAWGGKTRKSPYDALLRQLEAAGEGKRLLFRDVKARTSVAVRARKLGIKVLIGEDSAGQLWVKLAAAADDPVGAVRREKILGCLKFGASDAIHLAVALREKGDLTVDGETVNAILGQMARSGEVIAQEGGKYRLNPARKAA